jgi:hypothetical protein
MSDIGLIMNALLGVLLLSALYMGWRLERRLKTLRESHQSFTQAVADLDRAAGRAEQGLADLRAATDEAAESLAGRIERASQLAGRLEKLTDEAVSAESRLAVAPRPTTSRLGTGVSVREAAAQRFAARFAGAGKNAMPASAIAQAAARNDLILEDEPGLEPAVRPVETPNPRLDRLRALAARPRPEARPAPAAARRLDDDELFDAQPHRAAGGAR